MKELEEQRNQIVEEKINQNVEQQRQYSTNIPLEPTVGDSQRVMVIERNDVKIVQFQEVPILYLVSLEFLVK